MENPIVQIGFTIFPTKHTCDGEDISPEIHISRLESPYFAIILTDPGAKVDHWLIWNIRATDVVPEGIPRKEEVTSPIPALQGRNDLGTIGYSGPCLSEGAAHEYYFNLYGTDGPLDLPGGARGAELREALRGHTLQYSGMAVAGYSRKKVVI